MPSISDEQAIIPKNRLLTAISLIMLLEHKELGLDEVITATGMNFNEAINAMQNIVNIRLAEVIPTNKGIPRFRLVDETGANQFLSIAGISMSD
ncbi:MAG: hypothetical protein ACXAD7_16340 [Candidatus Kariarchaeaceae archaeon]|jgi:hypothetical protein